MVAMVMVSLVSTMQAQLVHWIVPISGPSNQHGFDVAVDDQDNVFVCGETTGDVDFQPGTMDTLVPYAGVWGDMYLAKYAPDGSLIWAAVLGSTGIDAAAALATDAAGNLYVGGTSWGDCDMDPGPGTTILSGETRTGFVMKVDPEGDLLWARGLAGWDAHVARVEPTSGGGMIAVGIFQDTLDVDPGPDSTLLISAGGNDVFLCRFDADGNLQWAGRIGSIGNESVNAMRMADNGDIVLAMNFSAAMDADPGPDTLLFPNSTNQDDIALLRIDPAGQLVWADHIHGTSWAETALSLALDADGNIVLGGFFCLTTDLDPGPDIHQVTSIGGNCNSFVARYDGAGNFLSAFTFGDPLSPAVHDMAVRPDGVIMLVGRTVGACDMDPGPGQFLLTPVGSNSGFVAFYHSDGTLITADLIGMGDVNQLAFGAAVDHNGTFLITGTVSGTNDLAPGPAVEMYSTQGAQDAYVIKLGVDIHTGNADPTAPLPSIAIAPNPVYDALMIMAPLQWARLELADARGRVILSHASGTAPTRLELGGLSEGVYLLRVTAIDGQVRTERVIVASR